MKLVPYDVAKIHNVGAYKKSENLLLIEEFIESEHKCVEVQNYPHSSTSSCQSALSQTIRKNGLTNVRCISRNGKVFLIKTV